jgi:hypothetical protein
MKSIQYLNETKRNAISHDLGAGIANLIMRQMGYAWMGLAEDHIDPKKSKGFQSGSRPDLIFDAGGGTNEYVAVEAKGSTPFPTGWSTSNLDSRLRKACTNQLANVMGANTFDGSIIARGLASGLLGVSGGPAATYRVVEAEPPTLPSRPLRAQSAAVSFPDDHSPMPLVAMRHYIGVMRLLGGDYTANTLLRRILRLTDREQTLPFTDEDRPRRALQHFFMERGFIVGESIDLTTLGWGLEAPTIRFAISSDVLSFLNEYIMDLTADRVGERITLPTQSLFGAYLDTSRDERPRLVDFDGLAIFTDQDLDEGGAIEI